MSLVLEKKLKKVLDLRTDSPAMIDALDSIAPFWGDNTLEARRTLRAELEERNVELANRFLDAFAGIVTVSVGHSHPGVMAAAAE